jgi:hypothetical protein
MHEKDCRVPLEKAAAHSTPELEESDPAEIWRREVCGVSKRSQNTAVVLSFAAVLAVLLAVVWVVLLVGRYHMPTAPPPNARTK